MGQDLRPAVRKYQRQFMGEPFPPWLRRLPLLSSGPQTSPIASAQCEEVRLRQTRRSTFPPYRAAQHDPHAMASMAGLARPSAPESTPGRLAIGG
jgi:hypothetical protein